MLRSRKNFLFEIKRILKVGGILILSTPLNETQRRFKPENYFHLREYNWEEFGDLVSKYFLIKERFSQISPISELNTKLSRLSSYSRIKRIIPPTLKNFLKKILKANSGKILKGFVRGLHTQIIIAIKI